MFKDNNKIAPSEQTVNNIASHIKNGTLKTPKSLKIPYKNIVAIAASLVLVASCTLASVSLNKVNKPLTVNTNTAVSKTTASSKKSTTKKESKKRPQKKSVSAAVNKNSKAPIKAKYVSASNYSSVYKFIKSNFKNSSPRLYGYNAIDDENGFVIAKTTANAVKKSSANVTKNTKSGGNGNYSKTNVQKQGIDEGDIVKTDGKYIYALDNSDGKVYIYLANGKNSMLISKTAIPYSHRYNSEMYVKDNLLIILGESYDNNNTYSFLTVYDITNKQKPKKIKTTKQTGSFTSSRLSGNVLYLVSNYYVNTNIKKDKIENYIPYITSGDAKYFVHSDSIFLPTSANACSYCVVASYNIEDGTVINMKSVLGGASEVYLDQEYLAVADYNCPYYKLGVRTDSTQIILYKVNNGNIEFLADGKVNGEMLNQFSIDIYKNYVRVVTTVHKYNIVRSKKYKYNYIDYKKEYKDTNALYVLNTKLNKVGAIEGLAKDERIYSARFTEDIGYFVTYKQTDPLFAVDLNNPQNPKILSALKIDGFSSYLHPYGNGMLLGFGYNTEDNITESLKLTMFNTSNLKDVKEIVTKTVSKENVYAYSDAIYNHKAFFVDVEKNIFGFEICEEDSNNYYVLYTYKNGKFKLLKKIKLKGEYIYNARGMYIDDYFYILYQYEEPSDGYSLKTRLQVYNMNTFKKVKTV